MVTLGCGGAFLATDSTTARPQREWMPTTFETSGTETAALLGIERSDRVRRALLDTVAALHIQFAWADSIHFSH